MKKITLLLTIALLFFVSTTKAQLQRGNLLVGGDIANFNLGLNSGGGSTILINPKLAFFFRDNVAIGPFVQMGFDAAKGQEPTTNYGIGAFGRYYVSDTTINLLKHETELPAIAVSLRKVYCVDSGYMKIIRPLLHL